MSVKLIPQEKKTCRKFTPQQKLQILKEWEATGNGVEMAQKHPIHPQTLYRWKKSMDQGARVFLSEKKPLLDPRIRKSETGNPKIKEALTCGPRN